MILKTLVLPLHTPITNPRFSQSHPHRPSPFNTYHRHNRFSSSCISSKRLASNGDDVVLASSVEGEDGEQTAVIEPWKEESSSVWDRTVEIMKFSGPATGLWVCGPLMSLIDTVVIGQSSSVELAALGPATVLCDNMSYVFMFLSIATSNMVATALARQDKDEVQHQISILIFIALVCGVAMLLFTKFFATQALTAFTGSNNAHIIPAANTYVQIRGLAWPISLVGWVTQSARYNFYSFSDLYMESNNKAYYLKNGLEPIAKIPY